MSHIGNKKLGNKKYVILACLLLAFMSPVIFAQDFESQTNTETKTKAKTEIPKETQVAEPKSEATTSSGQKTSESASNDQPEKQEIVEVKQARSKPNLGCPNKTPSLIRYENYQFQTKSGDFITGIPFHRNILRSGAIVWCVKTSDGVRTIRQKNIVSRLVLDDITKKYEYSYTTTNYLPLLLFEQVALKFSRVQVLGETKEIAEQGIGALAAYQFQLPRLFRALNFLTFELESGLYFYSVDLPKIFSYWQSLTRLQISRRIIKLNRFDIGVFLAPGLSIDIITTEFEKFFNFGKSMTGGLNFKTNLSRRWQIGMQVGLRFDGEFGDFKLESNLMVGYAF